MAISSIVSMYVPFERYPVDITTVLVSSETVVSSSSFKQSGGETQAS
ncbi:MAG: hypothetical protein F6K25_24450 [Okeania sp. SIO2G4]|nr:MULTISPECIES: hypothetical protein [unclassified Okeania]NEP07088.1 hypothetical protein [Okeania sp. SIO4D6]NEP44784.1 hypothetical protein [Okeania sp. SIO2H7]NEP74822.1 hypothetical protein [Okeania sp. SIO2G5]NEP94292.1 hypothetical protein [Okeania sp. SIO2F5]NEQ93639.1 hypothetical protein [Okeania sp. SIO2G4]